MEKRRPMSTCAAHVRGRGRGAPGLGGWTWQFVHVAAAAQVVQHVADTAAGSLCQVAQANADGWLPRGPNALQPAGHVASSSSARVASVSAASWQRTQVLHVAAMS